MRILTIDSSGLVATVAVVEDENGISKTIAEYTIWIRSMQSLWQEDRDHLQDSESGRQLPRDWDLR